MTPTANPWSFFDRIYCISIDTRIDRRTEAKKQFAGCGLLERVEFVLVKKHPADQERGIFQSHIMCLKKGLKAGAEHILIFEDDILIKNFQQHSLGNAVTFLQKNTHWNAFFLGAIINKMEKTDTQSVVTIQFRCLAHAYAVNRPFAEHIVCQSWKDIPFDNLLRKHSKEFYALSPMIAFQSGASTDNQTIFLDRMRRFLGGLPFIQKSNEFLQRHKGIIVCAHILVFMVLSLLTMLH